MILLESKDNYQNFIDISMDCCIHQNIDNLKPQLLVFI